MSDLKKITPGQSRAERERYWGSARGVWLFWGLTLILGLLLYLTQSLVAV